MNRVYYFDICALLVLVPLLISDIRRKHYRGKIGRVYVWLLTLVLFDTVFDSLRSGQLTTLGTIDLSFKVKLVSCYIHFYLRALVTPVYVLLISQLTGYYSKIRESLIGILSFNIPVALNMAILIINVFTGCIFTYSVEGDIVLYNVGSLIAVVYFVGFWYAFFALVLVMFSRERLGVEKVLAIISFYPINIGAIILHHIRPDTLIEMFATALCLLIMRLFILRIDEDMDTTSGASSYMAFKRDVDNLFIGKEEAIVVFLRLLDNKAVRTVLGNPVYEKMLRRITDGFMPSLHKKGIRADIYFLHNGMFAGLIHNYAKADVIRDYTNSLLPDLFERFEVDGIDIDLNVAVCVVRIPEDIDSPEYLQSFSESYHYTIPPNKAVLYSQMKPDREFMLKNNLDCIISRGICDNHFEMYYQPIYSVETGRFTSAEALIRLNDPEYGQIQPDLFIPAAEKSGAIIQIGDFVVDSVCQFLSSGKDREMGIEYVEINLSVMQCMQKNTAVKIKNCLEKYDIEPSRINFEITETMEDYTNDAIIKTMNVISENGNSFSLDDYGSGYSNLHRVMSFPYEIIKLDKSLVNDLKDERSEMVVEETIKMIKVFGSKIVVEGVEDEKAYNWFAERGCDYIQGFYFARPMPENEFINFLNENNG